MTTPLPPPKRFCYAVYEVQLMRVISKRRLVIHVCSVICFYLNCAVLTVRT